MMNANRLICYSRLKSAIVKHSKYLVNLKHMALLLASWFKLDFKADDFAKVMGVHLYI